MSGGTVWRQGQTISSDQFNRRWPERTEQMFTTTIRNQHGQVIGVDVQWVLTNRCDRCGGSLEGCPIGYSEDGEWVHDDCTAGNRLPGGAT